MIGSINFKQLEVQNSSLVTKVCAWLPVCTLVTTNWCRW